MLHTIGQEASSVEREKAGDELGVENSAESGHIVLRSSGFRLSVHFYIIIPSSGSSRVTPEKSRLRERNCPVPVYTTRHDPKRRCTVFVGQDDQLDIKKALCIGHMCPFGAAASFFTRLTSPRSCRDACEKICATPVFADDTRHDLVLGMNTILPATLGAAEFSG